jgi:tRNA(Arg) A34 adenosine deaminase TadA
MSKPAIRALTVKTAKTSTFNVFRHGATIEKGGRVIACGVNTSKPRTPNSSFSIHAEIKVLKRLQTILARQNKKESYELYVARVNRTDSPAFSKPCEKCLAAMKDSGVIGFVHYTTDSDKWESIKL